MDLSAGQGVLFFVNFDFSIFLGLYDIPRSALQVFFGDSACCFVFFMLFNATAKKIA